MTVMRCSNYFDGAELPIGLRGWSGAEFCISICNKVIVSSHFNPFMGLDGWGCNPVENGKPKFYQITLLR